MITLPEQKAVDKSRGTYSLLRKFKQILFIKYAEITDPGAIFAVDFKSVEVPDLTALFDKENLGVTEIERNVISVKKDPAFAEEFEKVVGGASHEILRLENGAEAMFIRPGGLDQDKTHPMIVQLHGGPFGSAAWHMFSKTRTIFLMQGFCLLIVNFRGSTGYGENQLNSLLGTIGVNDVEDCGDLTLMACEKFKDVVDPKRLGVEGGSHGGFLTGWLIGHPKYKDLWGAASLWNGVLNMSYMVTATDIPDWIFACTQNREFDFAKGLSSADVALFYERSPQSVVQNVTTPSMLLVGDKDLRCPPH